jgi:predicted Zn-dependent peptidase
VLGRYEPQLIVPPPTHRMLALILLGGLLASDTVSPPPFEAEARARARTGEVPARIIVHPQPEVPLVALRLSILADDPPGYSGTAHLVQHLQLRQMEQEAAQVGARVQIARTADAIVYSVMGPAVELDYLARVLRLALVVPAFGTGDFLVAMHELAEERLAEWETAEGHVLATLRSQFFPHRLPAPGSQEAANRLTAEQIPALWDYIYHPDRVSLVGVGNVTPNDVQAVFGDLRDARPARITPLTETVPISPLAPPEATHGWFGVGWLATDADPVAVALLGRLLERHLRSRMTTVSLRVEHWWTRDGQALVAVAATSETERPNARRILANPLGALQRELDTAAVRAAGTALRRELVFYARTPDRFAELLGSFADRGGALDTQQFYDTLEQLRLGDVLLAMDALRAVEPVRVEVAPQRVRSQ